MTPCPFCTHTGRYTDAYLRVRCEGCFNPLPGTPGPTDQALHDDTAPMVVHPVPPVRGEAQMVEPSEQMIEDAKQVRAYIKAHGGEFPRAIRYVVDEDGDRVDPPTHWENGPDSRHAS